MKIKIFLIALCISSTATPSQQRQLIRAKNFKKKAKTSFELETEKKYSQSMLKYVHPGAKIIEEENIPLKDCLNHFKTKIKNRLSQYRQELTLYYKRIKPFFNIPMF